MSLLCLLSVRIEASIVTTSPFLFPESELVTEPEEEEEEKQEDTKKAEDEEEEEGSVDFSSLADSKLSFMFDNWSHVLDVKTLIRIINTFLVKFVFLSL